MPVQEKLLQLGITPYKIPAGCTSLVQPIDVVIGKPFKDRVRSEWWDWMNRQGADSSVFLNATREQGAKWVADSWDIIDPVIVKNAWRKTGFNSFEN